MQNQSALTGTVLLEAFWSSRRKDMIDLITPFIHYAVAQTTSPNESINTRDVTDIIRKEFGSRSRDSIKEKRTVQRKSIE